MKIKKITFVAVAALFLFIGLFTSPVLADDRDILYTSDNFKVEYIGIGSHLLREPDPWKDPPNAQGIEPLKSLTIYEQSTVAPRKTNWEYFRTASYAYYGTKEPNIQIDNMLFFKQLPYTAISKEISKNFANIIEARNLGYGRPMITTLTYTRDFFNDYWYALNDWDENIDSVDWLLQIPTIEFYRSGPIDPEKNQTNLGYIMQLPPEGFDGTADIDAIKNFLRFALEKSNNVRTGFETYIDDMISRAEFINLRPEKNGLPLRIPFFRFTQIDLIEENGVITEVNIPIKDAPLENYLNGNKLNIKPVPGVIMKEWIVSSTLTEPSSWEEVKALPKLSSGTGTPTIKSLQMNTVIYVLHQKQPANPPDFYIKSLTANTTSTEPNKKYSGSVVYGLKDNGFPAQAKLTLTHNGWGVGGVNDQTVEFQPGEEKIFNFNFTGQNSNSLLLAKIDPVGIIDAKTHRTTIKRSIYSQNQSLQYRLAVN